MKRIPKPLALTAERPLLPNWAPRFDAVEALSTASVKPLNRTISIEIPRHAVEVTTWQDGRSEKQAKLFRQTLTAVIAEAHNKVAKESPSNGGFLAGLFGGNKKPFTITSAHVEQGLQADIDPLVKPQSLDIRSVNKVKYLYPVDQMLLEDAPLDEEGAKRLAAEVNRLLKLRAVELGKTLRRGANLN
jgi:hypothetical protein